MTLLRWVILFVLAGLADHLIKKYWGAKGSRIVWLVLAGYSLLIGIRDLNPLAMGFGILGFWLARPESWSRSPDNQPQGKDRLWGLKQVKSRPSSSFRPARLFADAVPYNASSRLP